MPQSSTALNLPSGTEIEWLSPLAGDDYAEYRDDSFLRRLGFALDRLPLSIFWPSRGPVWDALARTSRGEVILIEAKAHIGELVSPATGASLASLARIRASLERVRTFCNAQCTVDWTGRFYQYTNRLAHLWLLREANNVPAYLVHLYFINAVEMSGPASQEVWEGAIELLHRFLGLGRHRLSPFIGHAFIDVPHLAARQQLRKLPGS